MNNIYDAPYVDPDASWQDWQKANGYWSDSEDMEIDGNSQNELEPLAKSFEEMGLTQLFKKSVRWAETLRVDIDEEPMNPLTQESIAQNQSYELTLSNLQKAFAKLLEKLVKSHWGELEPSFGMGRLPIQTQSFLFNHLNRLLKIYFGEFIVGLIQKKEERRDGASGPSADDYWAVRSNFQFSETPLLDFQGWLGKKFADFCRDSYRKTYVIDLEGFKTWLQQKSVELGKCPGTEYHDSKRLSQLIQEIDLGQWNANEEREIELASLSDRAYRIIAEQILPELFFEPNMGVVLRAYLDRESPFRT